MELEFKAHWAIKRWNMDFEATGEKRKMQLSELEEWRKLITIQKSIKRELKDGMTKNQEEGICTRR
jgi:hypothetical protein